jgi:hypothetical protein
VGTFVSTVAFASFVSLVAVESVTLGAEEFASPLEQAFITRAEQAATKRLAERINRVFDFVLVNFLLVKGESAGEIKLKGVFKLKLFIFLRERITFLTL